MLRPAVDGERERRAAELGRVEAEEEVMHDRVADHRHLDDVAARDPRLPPRPPPTSSSSAARTAAVISRSPPGFIIA